MSNAKYNLGDLVLGSNYSYETTAEAWPKVIREMQSTETVIDGQVYGNPALKLQRRGWVDSQTAEVYRRGYLEVGQRWVKRGAISDLQVDRAMSPRGLEIRVRFRDVSMSSDSTTDELLPTWEG